MPTVDPLAVIAQFYEKDSHLWDVLVTHSLCVADLAVLLASRHPELHIDSQFVREAAMLHDIGIIKTDAQAISCFGSADYICHGFLGRQMLDEIGLPRHALVCERHTGSGITADYIAQHDLPLPHRDMLPISIEEKLVCYADKFFSKSKNLTQQKDFQRALASVAKYGDDSRDRFLALADLFGQP